MRELIAQRLRDLATAASTAAERLGAEYERAAFIMRDALRDGGTLFFCGNGGSAADAQHLATEYIVRYMKNRRALPAIALTTDTSLITAAGNDFGFDEIFARQVEALVTARDVLVIHSTSGNSPNVIKAAEAAKRKGAKVVAFSSRDGGTLRDVATHSVIVPTDRTDRAQEIHLCIEHAICEMGYDFRKKAMQRFEVVFKAQVDAWEALLVEAQRTAHVGPLDPRATAVTIVGAASGLAKQRLRGWTSGPAEEVAVQAGLTFWKGLEPK